MRRSNHLLTTGDRYVHAVVFVKGLIYNKYISSKGWDKMKLIDLHVHSTMSDGTYTPEEVIKLAKQQGLAAVTLTDHDTIDGLAEAAAAAAKTNVEFINGMEVSVDYKNRKLHVVALGFDADSLAFKKIYRKIRSNKEKDMDKIIAKIKDKGIDISVEKVSPFINGTKLENYGIMRYLVSVHAADRIQKIWDTYINPAVEELGLNKNVEIAELARGIHQAGGVLSLAHFHKNIGLKGLTRIEQEKAIAQLHSEGLDGMEKYYTNYTEEDRMFAAAMIDKYKLLPTGGSDFHGQNRIGVDLGTGCNNNLKIPYEFYENILNHSK
ncbi:PHP domain-containing protein [Pectinatus frisingensis]|uniref:PHP domain-containing protein n=1 Tax=Pectinatus frisingensis TaxID=865 RepID=UPI001E4D0751|nr:PHP domain-containing protein [Pectinatus frisingensis]